MKIYAYKGTTYIIPISMDTQVGIQNVVTLMQQGTPCKLQYVQVGGYNFSIPIPILSENMSIVASGDYEIDVTEVVPENLPEVINILGSMNIASNDPNHYIPAQAVFEEYKTKVKLKEEADKVAESRRQALAKAREAKQHKTEPTSTTIAIAQVSESSTTIEATTAQEAVTTTPIATAIEISESVVDVKTAIAEPPVEISIESSVENQEKTSVVVEEVASQEVASHVAIENETESQLSFGTPSESTEESLTGVAKDIDSIQNEIQENLSSPRGEGDAVNDGKDITVISADNDGNTLISEVVMDETEGMISTLNILEVSVIVDELAKAETLLATGLLSETETSKLQTWKSELEKTLAEEKRIQDEKAEEERLASEKIEQERLAEQKRIDDEKAEQEKLLAEQNKLQEETSNVNAGTKLEFGADSIQSEVVPTDVPISAEVSTPSEATIPAEATQAETETDKTSTESVKPVQFETGEFHYLYESEYFPMTLGITPTLERIQMPQVSNIFEQWKGSNGDTAFVTLYNNPLNIGLSNAIQVDGGTAYTLKEDFIMFDGAMPDVEINPYEDGLEFRESSLLDDYTDFRLGIFDIPRSCRTVPIGLLSNMVSLLQGPELVGYPTERSTLNQLHALFNETMPGFRFALRKMNKEEAVLFMMMELNKPIQFKSFDEELYYRFITAKLFIFLRKAEKYNIELTPDRVAHFQVNLQREAFEIFLTLKLKFGGVESDNDNDDDADKNDDDDDRTEEEKNSVDFEINYERSALRDLLAFLLDRTNRMTKSPVLDYFKLVNAIKKGYVCDYPTLELPEMEIKVTDRDGLVMSANGTQLSPMVIGYKEYTLKIDALIAKNQDSKVPAIIESETYNQLLTSLGDDIKFVKYTNSFELIKPRQKVKYDIAKYVITTDKSEGAPKVVPLALVVTSVENGIGIINVSDTMELNLNKYNKDFVLRLEGKELSAADIFKKTDTGFGIKNSFIKILYHQYEKGRVVTSVKTFPEIFAKYSENRNIAEIKLV